MVFQDEVEALFRKLKPVLGKDIDTLWLAYNTQTDPRSRAEIVGILYSLASKYLDETFDKKILLSLPEADVICGDYEIGKVVYGGQEYHPFGLRENEWLRHIAIFGTTGSGKTNCAFVLLSTLQKMKKPFLIFDWKRNYRDLVVLGDFSGLKIYTIGRDTSSLFFNPLIPPAGTKPQEWLKKLIEVMCHAYFLGEGVAYLLQKAIDTAYSDFGIYSDAPGEYPTLRDVLMILEKTEVKGRKALWMDSTLRTLGVLCFGEFGRVLNVRKPYPIADLLKENVILELDALTNSDKTFFIEALLLWIHHYRLSEGEREVFKHAIVIEEAHHILLRKKQEMTGTEAITDIILREIRELGEAIILIDQHPSLISLPALGNTYTTLCFGLKHRADMFTISESLLLEKEQVDFLGQLETGTAITKLQGRYFKPFLVRFPLFPIRKGVVSDSDLLRRNGSHSEESEVVRAEKTIRKLIRAVEGLVNKEEKEVVLNEEERRFLADIAKNPISGVVARYARLGVNRYRGNQIQNRLLDKKLISWRAVSTKTGRLKVLVLTDAGKTAIPDVKIEKVFNKNESWEHAVAKAKIAEHYKAKGYSVTMEYRLPGGRAVDIVAEKDGKRIAIEIETGKSDSLYNIRKDLEAGFDEVVVVAISQEVANRISAEINSLSTEGKVAVMNFERAFLEPGR
jgi:DNA-binding MarR family transcriptional regulator